MDMENVLLPRDVLYCVRIKRYLPQWAAASCCWSLGVRVIEYYFLSSACLKPLTLCYYRNIKICKNSEDGLRCPYWVFKGTLTCWHIMFACVCTYISRLFASLFIYLHLFWLTIVYLNNFVQYSLPNDKYIHIFMYIICLTFVCLHVFAH